MVHLSVKLRTGIVLGISDNDDYEKIEGGLSRNSYSATKNYFYMVFSLILSDTQ